MTNFNDLHIAFQANMLPAMVEALAEELGVSPDAIQRLGVGYYPAKQTWVFPERDEGGNIIGLLLRYANGKKYTWTGSKRGLSYECVGIQPNNKGIPEQAVQFQRVGQAGVPCPICGRENDGCLISDDDISDPSVVICVRTPEGAERELESGAGYLHRRHPQAAYQKNQVSILPLSTQPVIITEGASDCLAAMSLGYTAIGRPSAEAATKGLCSLVQGRDVIIVGDRDPHGAGQKGLESAFHNLKPVTRTCVKILPPEGCKDLRQWHPTREEFEQYLAQEGIAHSSEAVMESTAPLTLVKEWLQRTKMESGERLLHYIRGDFYEYEAPVYRKLEIEEVKAQWYQFFSETPVRTKTPKGVEIITLAPNKRFIADIRDAATSLCHVRIGEDVHEPFSIRTRSALDLARAVVFKNGILQLPGDTLRPLESDIFITSTLPVEYKPRSTYSKWDWFVRDIFKGDQECIDLLQEWFGYNLIASNHMQAMMFFWGRPGSGKSTTAAILEAMLGRARCCAASTETFRSLFGSAKLENKYAAVMAESRATNRHEIDKILQMWKAITGGDMIDIRQLYKAHRDTRLFCRLTYVANDALPFEDDARALAARMNLLYFPHEDYRKNNPDRMLEHKLKRELPGITIWAVEGLKRLLKQDAFTEPAASKVHLAQLSQLTNPIGAMLDECVVRYIGSEFMNYRTDCNMLYDLWRAWCDVTGTKNTLTSIGFGMKLTQLEEPIKRTRLTEGGQRLYVYPGISIRPESLEKYLKR